MAATSRDRGAHDDNYIDTRQDSDRRRWSEKFGVSPDQLKSAVDAVGSRAEDVERFLKERAQSAKKSA
jgi:hypothetical protein